MNTWIKIEDDLPPRMKKIWVYDEVLGVRQTMYGANFRNDVKLIEHLALNKVTHWTDYEPAPPEEISTQHPVI